MKYSLQWIIKHKGTFDFEEEITFPCEMFEKIAFPTVEFFPRGLDEPHCKEENETEGQGEAQG